MIGNSSIKSFVSYIQANEFIVTFTRKSSMKFSYKKVLFILFLTINCMHAAQAEGLPVVNDFTIEAKEAQKKQIPILVLFMSDSCHYCEIVLQDFLLPMQRDPEYQNKVILRQIENSSGDTLIDFEGNKTTYSKFSRKNNVWGVPHVMLFDSHGQVLTSIVGLLTVDFYYAYLENAINESLEKIQAGK